MKELLDKYFNILIEKFKEEIGIIYGIYTEENKLEVDLIVGDETEIVHGVRFFNLKKEVIFDLLENPKEVSKELVTLPPKEKKKRVGKEVITVQYTSENFPIDHYFVFYSKNGKLNKDITYCEMVPVTPSEKFKLKTFSLDPELFDLQVQA